MPALEGRRLEYMAALRPALASVLAARNGMDVSTDIRPSLAAAVALAAFDTAVSHWVTENDPDRIGFLLDECFSLIADAINGMFEGTQL